MIFSMRALVVAALGMALMYFGAAAITRCFINDAATAPFLFPDRSLSEKAVWKIDP